LEKTWYMSFSMCNFRFIFYFRWISKWHIWFSTWSSPTILILGLIFVESKNGSDRCWTGSDVMKLKFRLNSLCMKVFYTISTTPVMNFGSISQYTVPEVTNLNLMWFTRVSRCFRLFPPLWSWIWVSFLIISFRKW
jgi:hypothetical protein